MVIRKYGRPLDDKHPHVPYYISRVIDKGRSFYQRRISKKWIEFVRVQPDVAILFIPEKVRPIARWAAAMNGILYDNGIPFVVLPGRRHKEVIVKGAYPNGYDIVWIFARPGDVVEIEYRDLGWFVRNGDAEESLCGGEEEWDGGMV